MHRAAFLCLLAGGCCIGFAAIFVRLSDTGPVASAFWRTALAMPVLWAWAFLASRRVVPPVDEPPAPRNPPSAGMSRRAGMTLLAGLFFAVDLAVWHWSIVWTSVANATLLANLAPIFVTLAGWLIWRRKVTRLFLVGMCVAIAGMFVLVGPNFSIGGTRLMGDALGALTALFYAGYMLSVKGARDAGSTTAQLMVWSTAISAAALLPVALLSPQPFLPPTAAGWLPLAGLALVSQVMGQGLIAYAFAHLTASLSSVSLLIQPVVATLAAWALFGEAVGAMQFAGGAIVLAGIWIARKAS